MSEENGLPPGWTVATIGLLCSKPQYGWTTKAQPVSGTVRLLRTTDISRGEIDWDSVPIAQKSQNLYNRTCFMTRILLFHVPAPLE